jgi:putative ABC transport system permease protein
LISAKLIIICFRSLLINKLRTCLSMLGIIVGVASVVVIFAVGEGAKRDIIKQIESLGIDNIILRSIPVLEGQATEIHQEVVHGLSSSDAEKIARCIYGVADVVSIKEIPEKVMGSKMKITPVIVATTESYESVYGLRVRTGRFLREVDVSKRNFVCVLGNEVASILKNPEELGYSVRIGKQLFKVVGVLAPREWSLPQSSTIVTRDINRTIFLPLNTEYSLTDEYGTIPENLTEIGVRLERGVSISTYARVIRNLLALNYGEIEHYQMIMPQELLNQKQRTQRTLNIFLGCIAAVSLIVGGIGIMNIMLANVFERTHEIGIHRALGATKNNIAQQYLCESVLLTATGGVIGIIVGSLVAIGISLFAGWETALSFAVILWPLIMSTIVGICSGLYPAMKAASLSPITALRYQ